MRSHHHPQAPTNRHLPQPQRSVRRTLNIDTATARVLAGLPLIPIARRRAPHPRPRGQQAIGARPPLDRRPGRVGIHTARKMRPDKRRPQRAPIQGNLLNPTVKSALDRAGSDVDRSITNRQACVGVDSRHIAAVEIHAYLIIRIRDSEVVPARRRRNRNRRPGHHHRADPHHQPVMRVKPDRPRTPRRGQQSNSGTTHAGPPKPQLQTHPSASAGSTAAARGHHDLAMPLELNARAGLRGQSSRLTKGKASL